MSTSDESIEKLTETVNALAQALARSESRYQSIEKIYRWMATGLVAMAAIVFYAGMNFVARAYADAPDSQQQIVRAINDLREQGVPLNLGGTLLNVATLGKMMTMMQAPAQSQSKNENAQPPGGQPRNFQQAWDQTLAFFRRNLKLDVAAE